MLNNLNNLEKAFQNILGSDLFNVREFPLNKILPVDVIEKTNSYVVLADVPGVDKETIVVDFKENVLQISVPKQKELVLEDGDKRIVYQRLNLALENQVHFSQNVDESAIKASVKDGVLKVEIPKKEKTEKSTKIVID